MNAPSTPRKARTPRKPVITAATIQRAQELMTDHRQAATDLATFTAAAGNRVRLQVEVLNTCGGVFNVSVAGFAQLLAQDVVALEREAKRLGVELEPVPSAAPRQPAAPLTPHGEALLGQRHAAPLDDPPGVGVETPAPVLSAGVTA
jgi:hypothetical protein